MKKALYILLSVIILVTGCSKNTNKEITKENNTKMENINVIINNKTYDLVLEDNETVKDFIKLLPQEYNMTELNGNEKYIYLDKNLKTDSYSPKQIKQGDVMLFGDNCLVIFYKSFETSYSYTKIGHINNLDNLGKNNITVRFEKGI